MGRGAWAPGPEELPLPGDRRSCDAGGSHRDGPASTGRRATDVKAGCDRHGRGPVKTLAGLLREQCGPDEVGEGAPSSGPLLSPVLGQPKDAAPLAACSEVL